MVVRKSDLLFIAGVILFIVGLVTTGWLMVGSLILLVIADRLG